MTALSLFNNLSLLIEILCIKSTSRISTLYRYILFKNRAFAVFPAYWRKRRNLNQVRQREEREKDRYTVRTVSNLAFSPCSVTQQPNTQWHTQKWGQLSDRLKLCVFVCVRVCPRWRALHSSTTDPSGLLHSIGSEHKNWHDAHSAALCRFPNELLFIFFLMRHLRDHSEAEILETDKVEKHSDESWSNYDF